MLITRFKPSQTIRRYSTKGTVAASRRDGNRTKQFKEKGDFDTIVMKKLGAQTMNAVKAKAVQYSNRSKMDGRPTINSLSRSEFKDKQIWQSC